MLRGEALRRSSTTLLENFPWRCNLFDQGRQKHFGIGDDRKSTGASSWKSLVKLRTARSANVTLITLQPALVAGTVV